MLTNRNSSMRPGRESKYTVINLPALLVLCSVALGAWFLGSITSNGVTAQATPTRIAVVDVQKVVGESNFGKASYAKVKQLQEQRLARARQMDTELRNLELELNKPAVTQANRENLVRQVEEKRVAMKRFAEDADKEVMESRNRELVALNSRLMPVVEALSKEMGLAGVFNKFESGLVYSSDAIDITDALIQRFNAASPAAAAPATQPTTTQPPRTQATPRPQPTRRP